MQAAMEITARYCGKEMQDYGSCVASNPTSWQQQCHELKLKVARCTSSHPVIRKIRSDCAGEFTAFEQCLREHQAAVGSCAAHVTRFLSCVEAVDLASIGGAVPQPT
ncbi:hypothetical protein GJAV_G00220470 [Gymnothorax javanicus]|nr:hypothetical protein GJAV_G00220470 [Gymnothorax javanicus]